MVSSFQVATAVYEMLGELANSVRFHPAIQIGTSEESLISTSSATNWKLFIIGIIPPDNPINYMPVMRIKQEIPKSGKVPQQPKKRTGAGSSEKVVHGRVSKKHTPMKRDAFVQSVRDQFTDLNGGMPPDDTLLGLLCAHAWMEMGAVTGFSANDGSYKKAPIISTLNYNIGSMHLGAGSKPLSIDFPGTGNNVFWNDHNGVEHEFTSRGVPVKPGDPTYAIPYGGKLVVADATDPANKGFYDSLGGNRDLYVDVDTKAGGTPYLNAFKANPNMETGIGKWLNTLVNMYPGIKSAKSPTEYATALNNNKDGFKYFEDQFDHYVSGIQTQLNSYNNEYPDDSNAKMTGKSADATDDPSQRIMGYGSSTMLEDPLNQVYGRNIEADTVTYELLRSNLNSLRSYIDGLKLIPPLILLTNPQEFRRSHENLVDAGVKTRVGNIVHTWLEQPMKLNSSGVSAAQFAATADGVGGLTNFNRIQSLSYRNLMSLLMLYKMNGMIYDSPSGMDPENPNPSYASAVDGSILLPGSMYIHYDEHLYIGSFDSFSITDDAGKPHNLAYSFVFTVRYDIHVDLGVDAQMSMIMRG